MIAFYGQYMIALRRVEEFLLAPQRKDGHVVPDSPVAVPVSISNATFQWYKFQETEDKSAKNKNQGIAVPGWQLQHVNLEVNKGELVTIVGSVWPILISGFGRWGRLTLICSNACSNPSPATIHVRLVPENLLCLRP